MNTNTKEHDHDNCYKMAVNEVKNSMHKMYIKGMQGNPHTIISTLLSLQTLIDVV